MKAKPHLERSPPPGCPGAFHPCEAPSAAWNSSHLSSSCLDQFKVHEISMSIDLAPLIFFFFLQQIFEILISRASEFLIDEMHSEKTVDDKGENLASF